MRCIGCCVLSILCAFCVLGSASAAEQKDKGKSAASTVEQKDKSKSAGTAVAGKSGEVGKGSEAKPPVPVLATNAEVTSVSVKLSAIGIVEPHATVLIKAMVSGQLLEARFKDGQDVKKGDVLFIIDPKPYEAALRKAEANLTRDTVDARNAEVEHTRYDDLMKKNVVSKDEFDKSRTTAETKGAQVQADKAEVENARLQLEYCTIRSPLDGRTGSLLIDVGNLVKANDTPGLVNIHQTCPIDVAFSIPERELPGVKRAMDTGAPLKVEVVIPGDEAMVQTGTLSFLDNEVDRNTGTIRLKAEFKNAERRLWPKLFVNATLYLGSETDRVVVPSEAVQTGQKGVFVSVIQPDNSVENRPVKTGRVVNGKTVIESGVKGGELIITDGHLRLTPGAKVVVKKSLTAEE
ncbi:TPA: efflux RND transporter periplasmic adaptor subunit [Candidatus Sumerlaeota bacterium]|nr:efflux RND transporter periplasmic adaptor subunit [Candidatus Sumerlaeota bacterium]